MMSYEVDFLGQLVSEEMSEEDIFAVIREVIGDLDPTLTTEELRLAYNLGMFKVLENDILQLGGVRHRNRNSEVNAEVGATAVINMTMTEADLDSKEGESCLQQQQKRKREVSVSSKEILVVDLTDTDSCDVNTNTKSQRTVRSDNEEICITLESDSECVAAPDSQHVAAPDSQHVAAPDSQHVAAPDSQHVAAQDSQHDAAPDSERVDAQVSEHVHAQVSKRVDAQVSERVDAQTPGSDSERVVTQTLETDSERVATQVSASSKNVKDNNFERNEAVKPFSNYCQTVSRRDWQKQNWKPVLDKDYTKYQGKFDLKPISVACVDLSELVRTFYPQMQLKSGVEVRTPMVELIKQQEKDKVEWLKMQMNRKRKKLSLDASSDGMRKMARNRSGRTSSSSSSFSSFTTGSSDDSSNLMIPIWRKKDKVRTASAKRKTDKTEDQIYQENLKRIAAANAETLSAPKVQLIAPTMNKQPENAPQLLIKSEKSYICCEVEKLLYGSGVLEFPAKYKDDEFTTDVEIDDFVAKKIAWWLLKNEHDPAVEGVIHPELHDDIEADQVSVHSDDFEWSEDSSTDGCASDPQGCWSIRNSAKKIRCPNWADDYCGSTSLYAKIRTTSGPRPDYSSWDSKKPFKRFLTKKPKTCYAEPGFKVKSRICKENLRDERKLGAHIRSNHHKNNFRNQSLKLANYVEKTYVPPPNKKFTAQLEDVAASKLSAEIPVTGFNDNHDHLRSDAKEVLPHISYDSYFDISPDKSLMNLVTIIRDAGKWNNDLEQRWCQWTVEEERIAAQYKAKREHFIKKPEEHPSSHLEWLEFWNRRCTELEAVGISTENYNFNEEWVPFWLKRMQEILKAEFVKIMDDMKESLKIDKHTLRSYYFTSIKDKMATKKTDFCTRSQ